MAAKRVASEANDASWVSRTQLAALLGVTEKQVDLYRNRFNRAHERQSPTLAIFAPEWLRMWAAEQTRQQLPDRSADHGERLKAIKADIAELDLAQKRGRMVAIDDLLVDLGLFGGKVAEGIELIGRLDRECMRIMLEKLTEANEEFAKRRGISPDEIAGEGEGMAAPDSTEPPEAPAVNS